jgi:hypothetical protein
MKCGKSHKVIPLLDRASCLVTELIKQIKALEIDKNEKALIECLANNIVTEIDKIIFIDLKPKRKK